METTIQRLRDRVEATRTPLPEGDVFDLLAAACSQCCTDYEGGNKTCPPPPKKIAE
jgi:hypothetical protein